MKKRLIAKLARMGMRVLTLFNRAYFPDKAPFEIPPSYLVYYSPKESQIPSNLLDGLLDTYCEVFSGPPWGEEWEKEGALKKLRNDLFNNPEAFLVLMLGDDESPVAGFSWGTILPFEEVAPRIAKARAITDPGALEKLERAVSCLGGRTVYFDEFGVLPGFRKGLAPVYFLLRPGIELGHEKGITSTLFWTSWRSKIAPLANYVGYIPIVEAEKIVLLLQPRFLSLLKLCQSRRGLRLIEKIMFLLSGGGKRRA